MAGTKGQSGGARKGAGRPKVNTQPIGEVWLRKDQIALMKKAVGPQKKHFRSKFISESLDIRNQLDPQASLIKALALGSPKDAKDALKAITERIEALNEGLIDPIRKEELKKELLSELKRRKIKIKPFIEKVLRKLQSQ